MSIDAIDRGETGPYTTEQVAYWYTTRTHDVTDEDLVAHHYHAPACVAGSIAVAPMYGDAPQVERQYVDRDGQPRRVVVGWYDLYAVPIGGHVGRVSMTGTDRRFVRTADGWHLVVMTRADGGRIHEWDAVLADLMPHGVPDYRRLRRAWRELRVADAHRRRTEVERAHRRRTPAPAPEPAPDPHAGLADWEIELLTAGE